MVGWNLWEQFDEEITEIATQIYEKTATKRRELKIIDLSKIKPATKFYQYNQSLDGSEYKEMLLPFLEPYARMVKYADGKLNMKNITDMAEMLGLLENRLLSDCNENNVVVQIMPFSCYSWKDNKNNTWGVFREIINSEKTPKLHQIKDHLKGGSSYSMGFGADWLSQVDSCPNCDAPIYKLRAWYDTSETPLSYRCKCRFKNHSLQGSANDD